jgi:tetratricopeptide (TPR) repeat protein
MAKLREQTPARTYTKRAYQHYKRGDLPIALRLCRKAYKLSPEDPRVAWDYANVVRLSGYQEESIKVCRRLLARKPEGLVCLRDGRNQKWVRSFSNGCRLMIAMCYWDLFRSAPTEKWLKGFLQHASSTTSREDKRVARETLESIRNSPLIEQLLYEKKWIKAKRLIRRELKKEPDRFYWLATLAYISYQEDDCDSALVTIQKALALAPGEPLVLDYYALILRCLGRPAEAIAVRRRIMRKGEKRIGTVETTEGIRWARSLINDCRYDIALCFMDLKDLKSAEKSLKLHVKGRRPGLPSSIEAGDVKALQRELRRRSQAESEG